jgi:hydroxymethylbilane synthase
VQCRADDQTTLSLLGALEDESTRKAVTAERAFLSGLGGGCSVPVAAYAEVDAKDQVSGVRLTGLVISEDGKKVVKVTGQATDALQLGNQLAQRAISQGANDILEVSAAK